jgi:hypothetical protein
MAHGDASEERSILWDFLVMELPHPLRLLSLPLGDERRERHPMLATDAPSEIERSDMEEASISTFRWDRHLDKDMVHVFAWG